MRILMVCLGNICRSPIAEGILRHKAVLNHLDWVIDSSGTESYHVGKAPHQYSQSICMEHGIDISRQRARRFMPADLGNYERIYAMADDVLKDIYSIGGPKGDYSRVMLFLDELKPGEHLSVPDPWYGPAEDYRPVYNLIKKCCDAIITKYAEHPTAPIK